MLVAAGVCGLDRPAPAGSEIGQDEQGRQEGDEAAGSVRSLVRIRQAFMFAKPCSTGARPAARTRLACFCPGAPARPSHGDPDQVALLVGQREDVQAVAVVLAGAVGPVRLPGAALGGAQGAVDQHHRPAPPGHLVKRPGRGFGVGGSAAEPTNKTNAPHQHQELQGEARSFSVVLSSARPYFGAPDRDTVPRRGADRVTVRVGSAHVRKSDVLLTPASQSSALIVWPQNAAAPSATETIAPTMAGWSAIQSARVTGTVSGGSPDRCAFLTRLERWDLFGLPGRPHAAGTRGESHGEATGKMGP